MSRIRVYKVAQDLNVDQDKLIDIFKELGVDVRNRMSAVSPDAVDRVKRYFDSHRNAPQVEEQQIAKGVVKRRRAKPRSAPNRASTPRAEVPKGRAASASEASKPKSPAPSPVVEAPPVPKDAPAPAKAIAKAPPVGDKEVDAKAEKKKVSRKAKDAKVEEKPVVKGDAPKETKKPVPASTEKADAPAEPPAPAAAPPEIAAPPAEVHANEDVVATLPEPKQTQPEASKPPAASDEPASTPEPEAEIKKRQPPRAPGTVEKKTPTLIPQARKTIPPIKKVAAKTTRVSPTAPVTPPMPDIVSEGAANAQKKKGIDVWTGRPGVTVRQPPRSSQAGNRSGGPHARRVEIDPRSHGNRQSSGPSGPHGRRGGMWNNRNRKGQSNQRRSSVPSTKEMAERKKVIKIEGHVTLQNLAQRMSLKASQVLMKLMSMGMTGVNINSTLDVDTAKLVAGEFGWDVVDVAISDEQVLDIARGAVGDDDPSKFEPRPPIVTVMGHVDHGKTSLLDRVRKANVVQSEAGGITQHIGAYKVRTSRGFITFLDTPGHAAFTQMRARGAQVTDIVILVVAADDGVMPQTREAVNHAKAAGVPLIVAVNKIDKEGAQPDRIRRELAEMDLAPEEWGGNTIFCDVSAKTGKGVDTLLEMTALQAEILELKADPTKPAVGTVVEALLDRGKGAVARVVITDGTLHAGDVILVGTAWGKVRAMTDDRGRQVKKAKPSDPAEVLGLSEVPNAGDTMHVIKTVKVAQELAQQRKAKVSGAMKASAGKVSLEDLAKRMAEADQLELRLIVKADVQGSVEAVSEALAQLSTQKVRVDVIHAAAGGITEGDVNLAVASHAIIVGFNVRPTGKAGRLAESEGIEIRTYGVIYDAVDDVTKAMIGLLGPSIEEKVLGRAEVRQTFHIAKVGTVAGCLVQDGLMRRRARVRVVRDSVPVWDGKFLALKRFKDDAREVDKGLECGISLEGFNDVKQGDILECYEQVEKEATL